nr:MAG TPA: hypothetical protein [Caudoviricetes sp.]
MEWTGGLRQGSIRDFVRRNLPAMSRLKVI